MLFFCGSAVFILKVMTIIIAAFRSHYLTIKLVEQNRPKILSAQSQVSFSVIRLPLKLVRHTKEEQFKNG